MDSPDSPVSSTACGLDSFCSLPPLTPNFNGPAGNNGQRGFTACTQPARTVSSMQEGLQSSNDKAELHRVLQSIQCSNDFGIYFCESFRDPRRHYIDDYWNEVAQEAFGIEDLHRLVGRVDTSPLTDEARSRLHLFARLLDRLARRIDRVVLS